MKFICQITVAFAVVVLSESFLLKPQPVKSCSMKKCPPGKICVVQYGRPRCVRDPCTMVRCRPGTTCIVKGGKAYCQPDICSLPAVTGLCRAYFTRYFYNTSSARCDEFVYGGCGGNKNNFIKKVHCKEKCDDPVPDTFPKSCAAVLCQVGHICVVRNGKASCKPACKSSSDCKQQGSYCDTESGVCECSRYCLLPVSLPVCGSDGKQYGSLCQLNVAACEKKTTITTDQCKPIPPPDTLPNSCAAVLCQVGYICVVRNGIASCKPACKSNSDCKQQGSYCNTESGVCECSQICPLVYLPVFDSDGKEYGNQCQLNVAVCEKKTTITPVPRKPGYTKSG